MKVILRFKGGPGSGHHGHQGRPGKRGGSTPSGGGSSIGSAWLNDERVDTSDLPLSMGADWGDLNNPRAREFFIERAESRGKNIDAQIGRAQLDKMHKLANDDAYRLPEDSTVYFGLRGEKFVNMSVGDEFAALGTRSTADTQKRASTYAGQEGGVFEVSLRKGDVAIPSTVFNMNETVLLPGSKFRITSIKPDGTYVTDMVSDGKDYINELVQFRDKIDSIVSTSSKEFYKGGPGSGHHGHTGRPGKRGGSTPGANLSGLISKTREYMDELGIEDDYIYVDLDQPLVSKRRSAAEMKDEFGEPIATRFIYGQPSTSKSAHEVDAAFIDYLESRSGVQESLNTILQRELSSAPTLTIPAGDLNIVQKFVFEKPLQRYIDGKSLATDIPYALNIDGEYFMHNGNHRVAAEYLLGASEFNLKVLDLTSSEKEFYKGGPGSGHHDHRGIPGHRGGSLPGIGSPNYFPADERVWKGTQHDGKRQMTNIQTGEIGEALATKALQDIYGVEFSTLNVGVNNAPIDLGGDHTAVEVKAGPATNVRTAHHWRATVSTEGKVERELVKQMTKEEKRAYNIWKGEQVLERKNGMIAELSKIAGAPVKPVTIGVVLTADGSRGDVFLIPDFHLRLPWKDYASEQYYVGTYDYDG